MKHIAIVAHQSNPSICSSMMVHADLIKSAGYKVTLFILEDLEECFEPYDYDKVLYVSNKDLKQKFEEKCVDCVFLTTYLKVLDLKLSGIGLPMYLWMQGDEPHESFMRNHSYLRKYALSFLLWLAFKFIKGVVFVSDAMKDYYNEIYGIKKRFIVVPCLSEFEPNYNQKDRLTNSFVYIGGLSVWQCFEETLNVYKQLRTNDSIFHIITRDVDYATEKVMNQIGDMVGIKVYSITDRGLIPDILQKFQYGFLIRRDNVVNQVASPIKFLEYISCGVNVIMTEAVPSYAQIIKENGIGTVIDLERKKIILKEYNPLAAYVYEENFNKTIYINRYSSFFVE